MLLTACDDMHTHLYDVEHASLIEAFSGVLILCNSLIRLQRLNRQLCKC